MDAADQVGESARPISELVARLRDGDRDAAAELVRRHGALIRRRVRRSLPPHVRRLFDSQDILSTLYRRVDRLAAEGMIRAQTPDEALGLLVRIAQHAVIDKARTVRRIDRAEQQILSQGSTAHRCGNGSRPEASSDPDATMTVAFHTLPDPDDRAILALWLQGVEQTVIADSLGWKPSRVWWRWSRIRKQLSGSMREEQSG